MLMKFERSSSSRVLGLSFHSKRPWILTSLQSGVIQIWDYRRRELLYKFEEHVGPVRGINFHKWEAIFVSGGDDYKIKVFDYTLQRCLFTLRGHEGSIRTVQFHHKDPWIVSASDDNTIRIWNWQSRMCLSVLKAHSLPVMSALFHPKEYLLVSASLDQTVKVWDISHLKKLPVSYSVHIDGYIGLDDSALKYELRGHNRAVNWASFHPTSPLIVSGADDQSVKLWQLQLNDMEALEVGTLRGHMNNVSCVLFQSRGIIVSNSEDKRICVWDIKEKRVLKTFLKEHDRYWSLGCHPELNLLAAGHDSGFEVFKLERERPAFSVSGDYLYYVKDGFLHVYDYLIQRVIQSVAIYRTRPTRLNQGPRTLSLSPIENAILICSDADGGSYEIYVLLYDIDHSEQEAKRGVGRSAVFVSCNRFAVLQKSNKQVFLKNLENDIVRTIDLPFATDEIFYYDDMYKLLCRAKDKPKAEVFIYDLQEKVVCGRLETSAPIRYVVWSSDTENVALLSKHSIIIADKNLVHLCTLDETIRVKSGSWDNNGVFLYTTPTHIKYCLPNGDCGNIMTIDAPLYITKISDHAIFCLDRDAKNFSLVIDSSEYMMKLFLLRKRYDLVMREIDNSKFCGQSMVAYLHQKGFSEGALRSVKDERSRFNIALESADFPTAVDSASKINEKGIWYRLGEEALRHGKAGSITDYAYQQSENIERLSFLYLMTGNLDKLSKMRKFAESKNQVMSQFHTALYLGDVEERIKILEKAGHLPLAYATAKTHGLSVIAESLAAKLNNVVPSLPSSRSASLLMPPTPLLCCGDWPTPPSTLPSVDLSASTSSVPLSPGPSVGLMSISFDTINNFFIDGFKAFTLGEFEPALQTFRKILSNIHSIVGEAPNQVDKFTERIFYAKEYALACQLFMEMSSTDNPIRKQEMAAYATHCRLMPCHLRVGLMVAMNLCYTAHNRMTASNFAQRLLETDPTSIEQVFEARKMMYCADVDDFETHDLDYLFTDPPRAICGATYAPIHDFLLHNVSCPYCGTRFVVSLGGAHCKICMLAPVT